ncbi:uncharacterized protein LOC117202095 isoform X1 [Orcinus orca]|nr:uncharacterized protein LOC117202095 isoform X1 [Orcinus orca]
MTMSAPSPGQRLQKQREMPPRGLQSRPSPSDPPPTTPAQLGGSGGGARAPGRPHARAPRPRATRRGTGSGDGAGQRPSGGVGCEEAVVAEKRPEASALNNKRISEAWEVQDQGVSRFGVWFIPRDVQQREVYPTFCKNQLPSSLRSLGCDSQSPGLGVSDSTWCWCVVSTLKCIFIMPLFYSKTFSDFLLPFCYFKQSLKKIVHLSITESYLLMNIISLLGLTKDMWYPFNIIINLNNFTGKKVVNSKLYLCHSKPLNYEITKC